MTNKPSSPAERASPSAPLRVRLVMGYGFIVHGWVKLSRGPARFEALLTQRGVPFSKLMSWVVPSVELLGARA